MGFAFSFRVLIHYDNAESKIIDMELGQYLRVTICFIGRERYRDTEIERYRETLRHSERDRQLEMGREHSVWQGLQSW